MDLHFIGFIALKAIYLDAKIFVLSCSVPKLCSFALYLAAILKKATLAALKGTNWRCHPPKYSLGLFQEVFWHRQQLQHKAL